MLEKNILFRIYRMLINYFICMLLLNTTLVYYLQHCQLIVPKSESKSNY